MAPPQLPGDAPVADVLHPVEVGFGKAVGDKLGLPFLHHFNGLLGQRLHFHKPLGRDDGLHIVVAAVAGAHIVGVVLHLYQVSLGVQVGHNGLPGLVAVHAFVFAAQIVDLALVVQHPDDLQIMPQAHLEVVGVMGGGHLDAAGTEFHLGIVIGHHGDGLVQQGQDHVLAHNGLVALIVGVDADAGVTQHGFRTGSGHNDLAGAILQGVADVPQVAGLIHVFHLGIAQSGDAVGAPVDDPAALVDQALFIQGDEDLPDGLGAALVHGEPGAVPVAAGAQLLLLLHNPVAKAVLPVPNPLQELFPAQVIPGQTLLAQLLFHLDLGGNARMVHTGNPEGIIALHPLKADDAVLQGRVHGVTHVQLAGDVGGRHNDSEGLLVLVPLCVEIAALLPHLVNFRFHGLGLVDLVQFFCHTKLPFHKKRPGCQNTQGEKFSAVPPEFP
jgi:hypothetical protein